MKEDYVEGIIAKLKECEDICLLDLILQLLVKVGADNVWICVFTDSQG